MINNIVKRAEIPTYKYSYLWSLSSPCHIIHIAYHNIHQHFTFPPRTVGPEEDSFALLSWGEQKTYEWVKV